jgi:hypothetical protein
LPKLLERLTDRGAAFHSDSLYIAEHPDIKFNVVGIGCRIAHAITSDAGRLCRDFT